MHADGFCYIIGRDIAAAPDGWSFLDHPGGEVTQAVPEPEFDRSHVCFKKKGASSFWVMFAADQYCSNNDDDKKLSDATSFAECGSFAQADSECGTHIEYSRAGLCYCQKAGVSCTLAPSAAFSVYVLLVLDNSATPGTPADALQAPPTPSPTPSVPKGEELNVSVSHHVSDAGASTPSPTPSVPKGEELNVSISYDVSDGGTSRQLWSSTLVACAGAFFFV
jgi:hypothetical protein